MKKIIHVDFRSDYHQFTFKTAYSHVPNCSMGEGVFSNFPISYHQYHLCVCFFIADRFAYICMTSYSSLFANFGFGILLYLHMCVCERLALIFVAGSCT